MPEYACVRALRSILAVGAAAVPVPARPAAVPKLPTPATLLDSPVPELGHDSGQSSGHTRG